MQSLSWYVRRIRSMGPAEIVWRVRSLFRDQTDIVRVPLGLIPKFPVQNLSTLGKFKPGFSCSPIRSNHWSSSTSESMQSWLVRLIQKSDKILEDRLSYFDLSLVDHGNPFNWHRDHSSGKDAPIRLSVLTDYRNFSTYGDCKLVWEPNRHHQLVVLARAYVATMDTRYAAKAAEILRSWIDANPFGYGMNWKSPLELGVRIINWVWAIDLIRDSNVINEALWHDIQQSMYQAIWDSQRKFSRGSSANNHLIGEAAGVFIGACYFSSFPNADHWARKSQVVLEREIKRQTYDDGCTREHAFGYQFFVIQFFTQCMLAGEATGHPFTNDFRQRLRNMYLFLHELSADTGSPPNMGDGDDGYVLDLGDLPDNAAALLAIGADIFDEPRLKPAIPAESVFWQTGKFDQRAVKEQANRPSRSFAESGYHLLRSERMQVFFDCAALGYGPIAAHGHADCLSVCVSVDGRSMIVDSGTYDYFTFPDWRNYFRETRAHNTAEIDGRSQSEMLGPFMWGRRATAQLVQWKDDSDTTIVIGEHDGYTILPDPVVHRRSVRLDKNTNSLHISDSFTGNGSHKVRIHFHLDPECQAEQVSDNAVNIVRGDTRLELSTDRAIISCIRASAETKLGWISNSYHRRQASTCIRLEQDINGESTIESRLVLG